MAVAAGVIYGFSLKATREEGKKTNTVSSSSFRVESYTQYRHTHTQQPVGRIYRYAARYV